MDVPRISHRYKQRRGTFFSRKTIQGNQERKKQGSHWLGHWESHFELRPKPDSIKINSVGRELDGLVVVEWRGLRTVQNLPTTWKGFVEIFKKLFLQRPS